MCSILSTDVWKWRVRNTLVSWHTCFIVLFRYLFSSSALILQCIVMWLHQMKWTFTSQGGEILWLPFPHMEGEYFVGDTQKFPPYKLPGENLCHSPHKIFLLMWLLMHPKSPSRGENSFCVSIPMIPWMIITYLLIFTLGPIGTRANN